MRAGPLSVRPACLLPGQCGQPGVVRGQRSVSEDHGAADVLRAALLALTDRIQSAVLFGSLATGETTSRSDADVLVIGDVEFGEVSDLLAPAEQRLGREVRAVAYIPERFAARVREAAISSRQCSARRALEWVDGRYGPDHICCWSSRLKVLVGRSCYRAPAGAFSCPQSSQPPFECLNGSSRRIR